MTLRFASFASLASAVALAVSGCAAAEPAAESDLASTDADLTGAHLYDCSTGSDQDQLKRFELEMSPTAANITDISKDAAPPDSGKIDPTYRPTADFAGAIRYRGFDKLTGGDISVVDLIVPKAFQDSPAQGKLLLRSAGPEGGGSTVYFCKTKAKKLAVDLAVKARLNCNLSLECTDENPPGQTCLDTTFVTQTGPHAAKMKTTFLDHFGVHVVVRPVDVGPASELERTATHFSATFAGESIDLQYRAGITYTGKLKLDNGRISDAKCNDLAMLD